MRIQGQFEIEVDEDTFENYAFLFEDPKPSDETIAEELVASLLLGMYRGGTANSAQVDVTDVN